MVQWRRVGLLFGTLLMAWCASAREGSQPTLEISYEQALELARQRGPELAAARARVAEAQARLEAASVWRFNPQLGGSAGPRFADAGTLTDWSLGATQWFELGGQRGSRGAAARADIEAFEARSADVERLLSRQVGLAFVEALHLQRRAELAEENLRIATEIARIARQRHEAGDVGGLDEAVASLSMARAQTDGARVRAALARVRGRLKALLGLEADSELVARDDLRRLGLPGGPVTSPLEARPDLRALGAELRRTDSQAALARASRVPDIGVGAEYSREEGASIVEATLQIELPLFDRGQGAAAVAEARRGRLQTELLGVRRQAEIEIATQVEVAHQLGAAARQFEQQGLATLERSERLAAESYRAGAIPLGELLSVRRELVQARIDYAELLLGAATARIELAASRGGPR